MDNEKECTAKFKLINEAHDILLKDIKREKVVNKTYNPYSNMWSWDGTWKDRNPEPEPIDELLCACGGHLAVALDLNNPPTATIEGHSIVSCKSCQRKYYVSTIHIVR